MEILNQLPSLSTIIGFIVDGFFLGALIGAIVGASVWTMMERGTFGFFPITVTAILGVLIGLYIEGDIIRSLSNRDWTTFFSGPVGFREAVFEAVVKIIGWSFSAMIIGALISNYRLASLGFVIGGLMGTLSGILVIVMGSEFGFPVNSPITSIVVAIIAVLLMVLASAGKEREFN